MGEGNPVFPGHPPPWFPLSPPLHASQRGGEGTWGGGGYFSNLPPVFSPCPPPHRISPVLASPLTLHNIPEEYGGEGAGRVLGGIHLCSPPASYLVEGGGGGGYWGFPCPPPVTPKLGRGGGRVLGLPLSPPPPQHLVEGGGRVLGRRVLRVHRAYPFPSHPPSCFPFNVPPPIPLHALLKGWGEEGTSRGEGGYREFPFPSPSPRPLPPPSPPFMHC